MLTWTSVSCPFGPRLTPSPSKPTGWIGRGERGGREGGGRRREGAGWVEGGRAYNIPTSNQNYKPHIFLTKKYYSFNFKLFKWESSSLRKVKDFTRQD